MSQRHPSWHRPDFSNWRHHRRKELPPEEAAWETYFQGITLARTATIEHTRKTWAFRVRYWLRRKFVWRA